LGICQHAGLTAQVSVIKPAQNRQNKDNMTRKKQYTRSTRAQTLNLKKCKQSDIKTSHISKEFCFKEVVGFLNTLMPLHI
jgi:hypothetical protein